MGIRASCDFLSEREFTNTQTGAFIGHILAGSVVPSSGRTMAIGEDHVYTMTFESLKVKEDFSLVYPS